MNRKHGIVAVSAVLLLPMAVPVASAQEPERVSVVADGLQSPRGVATDADGNVYVAEGGTGGTEHCIEVPGEQDAVQELCFGTTSTVTRVTPEGSVERGFVDGLPSVGLMENEFIGAQAVTVAEDGTVYIVVGWGLSAAMRDGLVADFPAAAMFGTVQRLGADGSLTEVADVAQWEQDNNPDQQPPEDPDSNPNAARVVGDTLYVVDAGGNTLLAVDLDSGEIEQVALFPEQMAPVPPFLGGDGTAMMPVQAVPTSITEDAEGNLLVGQLTGFPFPVGGANVYEVDPASGDLAPRISGLTNVTGVTVRGDDVFAVQLARAGLLAAENDPRGSIVRVAPNGARFELLDPAFVLPYGIAAGADDMLYVSVGTLLPQGSLLRVDPSLAGDEAIQAACPPDQVMGTPLSDLAANVHAEAILCLTWHGLMQGGADGTFDPDGQITRGQAASALVRLAEAAGDTLPVGDRDFPDLGRSVHAEAVRKLANAGVVDGFGDGTFRPGAAITRAQMVTMVVGTHALVGDDLPPAEGGTFGDVTGSVHAGNIDRAAAAGWVAGTGQGNFSPQRPITRAQTASVLARVASTLVSQGALELPSGD